MICSRCLHVGVALKKLQHHSELMTEYVKTQVVEGESSQVIWLCSIGTLIGLIGKTWLQHMASRVC